MASALLLRPRLPRLRMADRGYVMETGRVVLDSSAADLLRNDLVRRAYLGG